MKVAVITQPGFEQDLQTELAEIWPFLLQKDLTINTEPWPEWEISRGCIEADMDLFMAVQLNFFSRLASRVLLRSLTKKVSSQAQVFQHLSEYPWKQTFSPDHRISVKIDLQSPLVNNEKWLKEKLFKDRFTFAKPYDALVSLRGNLLQISLNSSGEHLHKRGVLRARGAAPLRETIAQFCLRKLFSTLPLAAHRDLLLHDPMVGSGTFLYEADRMGAVPLAARPFAFQSWLTAPKIFRTDFLHNYRHTVTPKFSALWGADLDDQMLKVAQANLSSQTQAPVTFFQADFLNQGWHRHSEFQAHPRERRLMIFNPPYGQRLQFSNSASLEQTVLSVLPEFGRVGLLVPKDWSAFRGVGVQAAGDSKGINHQVWPVANQGIDCEFHVLFSSL